MCHVGDTEIGGFGIAREDDLLLIEDFVTVKQHTTAISVEFDDAAVADFFDDQIDVGRQPEQFARIWLHTHPGDSSHPSCTDETTFQRVFGTCSWSVMAILARGGQTYARLQFSAGPGGSMLLPVMIDYSPAFTGSDQEAWLSEYKQNVIPQPVFKQRGHKHEDEIDPFDVDDVFDGVFDDREVLV